MKRVIAILLLLTVVAPALLKFSSVVNYMVEYDYYVNVLCENKDQPELKCNGTCHLAKEIKQAEEANTPPELPVEVKYEITLFHEVPQEIEMGEEESHLGFRPVYIDYSEPSLSMLSPPPKG